MEETFFDLMEFLKRPSVYETFVDILLCAVPIWLAVMIGLVIGWSWRPRWTGLVFLGLRSKLRFAWTAPPGFGARRLWFAFTALSAFSVCRTIWFNFRGKRMQAAAAAAREQARSAGSSQAVEEIVDSVGLGDRVDENELDRVTEKDLEHLLYLLEEKKGDLAWQNMMERSTTNMAYQAWRHDHETGPVVYKSRTVFEDATPEIVRDFFWDDEFRPKWDPMLSYFKILEECPRTGEMVVHWIKKFPFFCSDREYIIGRRIWESGKSYYCVTKGVPYPNLPKRDKPRRVDLYFSSWVIRPVESRKGDGQLTACEVILVHYEDMGIPKDVAKLGVRHGMWGTVRKLHSGLRAYQNARKSDMLLSRCSQMAGITTKISHEGITDGLESASGEEARGQGLNTQTNGREHGLDWKWVAVGGTAAVVCALYTGAIGKVLLLGAAQRIARK
uniref:START domain-containing protein n=1 Tax=Kalanchoe fedtschenkoi TaxID=63787 RepID=A0A7N0V1R5_KALFE